MAKAEDRDSLKQLSHLTLGTANDLFQNRQKSDKYFSASFSLRVAHDVFDNKIARKALFASPNGYSNFSLGLRQDGFTPEDLTLAEVDSSDIPYAGTLMLNYKQSCALPQRNWIYQTSIRLGVSGPMSLVEKMQKGIHKATGSTPPQGWENQISNSLILQYGILAEKQFLTHKKYLRLGVGGHAEVGSFYNYITGFAHLKVGWFHQEYMTLNRVQYKKNSNMSKWQAYFNLYLSNRFVLYNGTLQGGLIPFSESPYTVAWDEYEHSTTQTVYAIAVSYKNIQIQYWNAVEIGVYIPDDFFSFGAIGITIPLSN